MSSTSLNILSVYTFIQCLQEPYEADHSIVITVLLKRNVSVKLPACSCRVWASAAGLLGLCP